ncbi:NUDIX hydrolase domain-like protein [Durotheca rogersii]|uniref:NUDIX hydrolase domain-like protein n=1 Tax=Durotheca rogersii TaxID=419775 RepID=UPI002220B59B|nr:NUDIX hydrolase domain-like protein [Durotheca rogersii]KAI5864690.1 NUDIX hydrolase domain-like protein [Durotheca rogersii]
MADITTPQRKTIGAKEVGVQYVERQAVRVVAFNTSGHIAIIHAKRDNYYKLPGGGIDPGEDHLVAVQREMQEETGALIRVRERGCVATTEEFRNNLHQLSFCYCADLVDDAGRPNLTEEEVDDQLQHLWLPVDEAKRQMAAAVPTSALGQFIKERDLYLLREATK